MVELIGLLASLLVCILTPIQVSKMRSGWLPKKFKGTHEQYFAIFDKQLVFLLWAGIIFGILEIVMMFLEDDPGERIVKLVAAILWFAVAIISFVSRRTLAKGPVSALPGK